MDFFKHQDCKVTFCLGFRAENLGSQILIDLNQFAALYKTPDFYGSLRCCYLAEDSGVIRACGTLFTFTGNVVLALEVELNVKDWVFFVVHYQSVFWRQSNQDKLVTVDVVVLVQTFIIIANLLSLAAVQELGDIRIFHFKVVLRVVPIQHRCK